MEDRYPGEAPGVFRISNSTIEQYLKCGVYHEKARELKHKRVTVAMLIGTAISEAGRVDNVGKMRAIKTPLKDLIDVAVAEYEVEADESEVSESRVVVRQGIDTTRDAARAYGEHVSPKIKHVALAEEAIIAEIDDKLELAGRPDCIERDDFGVRRSGVVRDTKTGQPWTQQRVDQHRQMTSYSILHEAKFGNLPGSVVIDSVYKTRKGTWTATSLWTSRSEEDCDAYVELVRRTRTAIEAGIALPAAANSWYCSLRWCPFARECAFFRGD